MRWTKKLLRPVASSYWTFGSFEKIHNKEIPEIRREQKKKKKTIRFPYRILNSILTRAFWEERAVKLDTDNFSPFRMSSCEYSHSYRFISFHQSFQIPLSPIEFQCDEEIRFFCVQVKLMPPENARHFHPSSDNGGNLVRCWNFVFFCVGMLQSNSISARLSPQITFENKKVIFLVPDQRFTCDNL